MTTVYEEDIKNLEEPKIIDVNRIEFKHKNKTHSFYFRLMREAAQIFDLVYNSKEYGRSVIEILPEQKRIYRTVQTPMPGMTIYGTTSKLSLISKLKNRLMGPNIIALVDSDSPLGELDDLTNEFSDRHYDGLKVNLLDTQYEKEVTNFLTFISGILKEPVELYSNLEKGLEDLSTYKIVPSKLKPRVEYLKKKLNKK